jgi:hypothetical protein
MQSDGLTRLALSIAKSVAWAEFESVMDSEFKSLVMTFEACFVVSVMISGEWKAKGK